MKIVCGLAGLSMAACWFFTFQIMEESRWIRRLNPASKSLREWFQSWPVPVPHLLCFFAGPGILFVGGVRHSLFLIILGFSSAAIFEVFRRERLRRKQSELLYQLPDFLDLLGLGVSTGWTLERAWAAALRLTEPGQLKTEAQAVHRVWKMGGRYEEAFSAWGQRLPDPRSAMTLALLSQSLRRGTAVHQTLHEHASALRKNRLHQADKRAHTAGLRLLLPLFLFIFPTVFLLLFGPLFIRILQGGSLF